MRKPLQGRCPEDLCEAVCGQIEHGSLMIRPTVEVPRYISHRVSFKGPCRPENMVHRRPRILILRFFIDTFCPRRGGMEMMSGTRPSNQYLKTLDEAS